MSLSLSDLDDCATLLSVESPDFQLHDKVLTPELVDEPVADIQLLAKCALPELVDIPVLEPKPINKESEQECQRWWFALSKQQQKEIEQYLSEKEKQHKSPSRTHPRVAKRSSSFSSSASSFFSSSSFSSGYQCSALRRSSSLASLLLATSSFDSPTKLSSSSSSFSSPIKLPSSSSASSASSSCSPSSCPSSPTTFLPQSLPSLQLTEQQCAWAMRHLSSPARLEEKQMEAWWYSLSINQRAHIEKFIADTHSADPNCTERSLVACTRKFSLSESQYYWVLFRMNNCEEDSEEENLGKLECDPDLAGKHFFKNGHTFHASTTIQLLGPATVFLVRKADRKKLPLAKRGNIGILVEEPGPFTVYLRDFRLNLNNTKSQFRIEAEMCGKVYVSGWCVVHPRPPPARKQAALAMNGMTEVQGTPPKRRKRLPTDEPLPVQQLPSRSSPRPPLTNLTDLACPSLGKKKTKCSPIPLQSCS